MYYTLTVTNTITLVDKNFTCYLDLPTCEDYLLGELDTAAWDLADAPARTKALIKASKIVDRQNLVSKKNDSTQLLEFPRRAIRQDLVSDGNTLGLVPIYGTPASSSSLFEDQDAAAIVPVEVEEAVALMALSLLGGIDTNLEFENLTLEEFQYGPVKSKHNRSDLPAYKLLGIPCYEAWVLLRPWLKEGRTLDMQRVS